MTMTPETFTCSCGQDEHFIFVDHYHWGDCCPPEFSLRIHLNQNKGFWQRLLTAARYIAGRKGEHGAFDSIILDGDDVKRLRRSCDKFLVSAWEADKVQAAQGEG